MCTSQLVEIVDSGDSSSDVDTLETPVPKRAAAELKPIHMSTSTLVPSTIKTSTKKLAALKIAPNPHPVKGIKSEASDSQLYSPVAASPSAEIPAFARPGWKTAFLPTAYAKLGSSTNPFQAFSKGPHVVKDLQALVDAVYEGSGYKLVWPEEMATRVRPLHHFSLSMMFTPPE